MRLFMCNITTYCDYSTKHKQFKVKQVSCKSTVLCKLLLNLRRSAKAICRTRSRCQKTVVMRSNEAYQLQVVFIWADGTSAEYPKDVLLPFVKTQQLCVIFALKIDHPAAYCPLDVP